MVIVPFLEGDALHPFIDHRRHLIKITFIYKGTDFIDLPSIFKDKSVISSIPSYFLITEPPIIFISITSSLDIQFQNLFLILTSMLIHLK